MCYTNSINTMIIHNIETNNKNSIELGWQIIKNKHNYDMNAKLKIINELIIILKYNNPCRLIIYDLYTLKKIKQMPLDFYPESNLFNSSFDICENMITFLVMYYVVGNRKHKNIKIKNLIRNYIIQ